MACYWRCRWPAAAALASAPVATTAVLMPRSYHFAPAVITVPTGATVTWENDDDFTHSVHLLDGSDIRRTVRPFQSTSITFSTPGTYRYECSLHPQDMQGVVIVGD